MAQVSALSPVRSLQVAFPIVPDILAYPHRTEVRAAHCAVPAAYMVCCPVIFQCTLRIQTEVELVFPAELVSGLAQGVVPDSRPGMHLGQVGGVCSQFVCHYSDTDILPVRQGQMLLRSDIAEHCGTEPADLGGADSTRDISVTSGPRV